MVTLSDSSTVTLNKYIDAKLPPLAYDFKFPTTIKASDSLTISWSANGIITFVDIYLERIDKPTLYGEYFPIGNEHEIYGNNREISFTPGSIPPGTYRLGYFIENDSGGGYSDFWGTISDRYITVTQ